MDVYGHFPAWHLSGLTHDQAYNDVWQNSGENENESISIEKIVAMLDNSDELLDYLT